MEFVEELKAMPKHCKTAFQNIWRNGVMSISSIFAVNYYVNIDWCCFSYRNQCEPYDCEY